MRFRQRLVNWGVRGALAWGLPLGIAHAADTCNVLPPEPQPAWVTSSQGLEGGRFLALGSSDGWVGVAAIEAARAAAQKALAETIQVSVRSEVSAVITETISGEATSVEAVRRALSETTTNVALRSVSYSEPWLDRSGCVVWVQASVAKETVERVRAEQVQRARIEQVRDLTGRAQETAAPAATRLALAKSAGEILAGIDFALIPDVSRSYFQGLVDELTRSLSQGQGDVEAASAAMKDAALKEERARLEFDEARRNTLQREAMGVYRELLVRFPKGVPQVFAPAELTLRLGDMEAERNNPCMARRYYLSVFDLGDAAATDRARTKISSQRCSPADQERASWRQAFEGRKVQLICAQKLGGKLASWAKSCDALANVIRPYGAAVESLPLPAPAELGRWVEQGQLPVAGGDVVQMVLLADGKINQQKTSEGGQEMQFSGAIATLVAEGGRTVYSDRFQGVTGWNPLGQQMVLDVLALNVVKRWQERYGEYLKNR